jgi:mannitol/fructose-specific phosphotransferase system IIA component (Ntr-type)
MAVGISRVAIADFPAIDDAPVRLLFMVAATAGQHGAYLHLLSSLSARIKNPALREGLLAAATAQEAYDLLVQA